MEEQWPTAVRPSPRSISGKRCKGNRTARGTGLPSGILSQSVFHGGGSVRAADRSGPVYGAEQCELFPNHGLHLLDFIGNQPHHGSRAGG